MGTVTGDCTPYRKSSRHRGIKARTSKALERSSKHTFPSRGETHPTATESPRNATSQALGSFALCARLNGSRLSGSDRTTCIFLSHGGWESVVSGHCQPSKFSHFPSCVSLLFKGHQSGRLALIATLTPLSLSKDSVNHWVLSFKYTNLRDGVWFRTDFKQSLANRSPGSGL